MRAKVLSGIDRLDVLDKVLAGRRVGLVVGGSSIDRNHELAVDILCRRYHVTALFNTIFGIRGEYMYGERVERYIDGPTGLPVVSIFNKERTAPTAEMLEQVDVVVFDIKEAGVRYYEYLYCLADLMKACAACGKAVVVLDRVDPIGGEKVEGTVCPPDMHTMVGDYQLAIRTGMTIGEFARYVQGEFLPQADLTVVPLEGWKRSLYMDETDAPWVLPSPSLPHTDANLLYTGMCIFEGVATINEGKPFTIGIRADMDALPITEATGLPFSSLIEGQMHACGHDVHTAQLLAVGRKLNDMRDELRCCVKLIFTPAEEYLTAGARLMVEDGLMSEENYRKIVRENAIRLLGLNLD